MIPFVKAHASGNDFLIVEDRVVGRRHVELARTLCSRNTGIGADGVEFLDRRSDGEFFLRLFNSDGSEAELSGNGTRCVASWLSQSEGLTEASFRTHAGLRTCRVLSSSGATYEVESRMGVPRLIRRRIDLPGIGIVEGALVNVGNPHFVVKVDGDFVCLGFTWQDLGRQISTSPIFPHGINVEFLHLTSPDKIEFRIYERGCGPTKSSGTGTCASATAAIALYGSATELTAVAEGGAQRVIWSSPDEEMLLLGSAQIVCTGEAFV